MHKTRNNMYISDEQLHATELCISHGIKVQVQGLHVESISQMCRCTGSQSWRVIVVFLQQCLCYMIKLKRYMSLYLCHAV